MGQSEEAFQWFELPSTILSWSKPLQFSIEHNGSRRIASRLRNLPAFFTEGGPAINKDSVRKNLLSTLYSKENIDDEILEEMVETGP